MADAADSKSAGGDIVRVQVPPSASLYFYTLFFSFFILTLSKETVQFVCAVSLIFNYLIQKAVTTDIDYINTTCDSLLSL